MLQKDFLGFAQGREPKELRRRALVFWAIKLLNQQIEKQKSFMKEKKEF